MATKSIVVSLRSKGLASLNRAQLLDFKHHIVSFSTEVLDVIVSFILTFFHLSWSSWLSLIETIIITGVVCSSKLDLLSLGTGTGGVSLNQQSIVQSGDTSTALFLPFIGVLYLPLLALLLMVFWRREDALQHLGNLKAYTVSLCLASQGLSPRGPDAQQYTDLVKKMVIVLVDDLHRYLHHNRPYARHFFLPYWSAPNASEPESDTLYNLSREMGLLLRKVHRSVRDVHNSIQLLRAAGLSEAKVDLLRNQVVQLHICVEQLSQIKEMRSPLLLRSFVRWMTVIVFPIFMGFVVQNLVHVTNLPGMLGLFNIFVQIGTLTLLDTAVSLEDPFDDTSVDTLSLFEALDHIAMMTSTEDNAMEARQGIELTDHKHSSTRGARNSVDTADFSSYSVSLPTTTQSSNRRGQPNLPMPPMPSQLPMAYV
ncbi:hypothetical protein CEUSTIGMA_g11839.t1 [Chlamydomonas eustigma]|uniref:Uncharacterized protein n=1 Tax=Chlamydomonas eustigma TaxID=1157962 RepID=A0A250XMX6_9CHLO|nr:hypothetical protein CEUSTIGMA_g11839.t1 [Chlamydomonas eustigma]|eukprot:GAX84418.1 hypothetical protein CEUSTIGMA_g11839.t1 [Chlamydomonas eustigma]